ncbi:MAG: hypothetical protein P8R54_33905 [Myxococcota bacterium]|nr:hypothetical protein [Myxococcota bacterium]
MTELLLLLHTAHAADLSLDGEIREVGRMISDFAVDAEGTTLDQGMVLEQRIRLGGAIDWDQVSVGLAGDVLTGPIVGDPWGIPTPNDILAHDQRQYDDINPTSWEHFALRRAAVSGTAGPVQLEGGVVTSHWGLGMLANDGDHDRLFGQTRFGDRVLRVRATTRLPQTPLYFSGAVDRVIEDDLARWMDGQVANQAIFSMLYRDDSGLKIGAYGVARTQYEADDVRSTSAQVLDMYADVPFSGLGMSWRAAVEVAGITGSTNRSMSYVALDELAVRSLGATGLLEALVPDRGGLILLGGYASGDGDLDDGTAHDFTFDRDFGVGQVLFPEVIGAVNAGTYALLDDPEFSAQPPPGAEAIVTEGAFQRAAFFSPVARFTPTSWSTLRAGAVLAWATAPIAQPFYTTRAGGTPTSHHDLATTGARLGTELCWAAAVGAAPIDVAGETVHGSLEVQGGHAMLSEDLAGPGAERVDLYSLTGRLSW